MSKIGTNIEAIETFDVNSVAIADINCIASSKPSLLTPENALNCAPTQADKPLTWKPSALFVIKLN